MNVRLVLLTVTAFAVGLAFGTSVAIDNSMLSIVMRVIITLSVCILIAIYAYHWGKTDTVRRVVPALWVTRDALAHVDAGQALDDGEAREIIDGADRTIERYVTQDAVQVHDNRANGRPAP